MKDFSYEKSWRCANLAGGSAGDLSAYGPSAKEGLSFTLEKSLGDNVTECAMHGRTPCIGRALANSRRQERRLIPQPSVQSVWWVMVLLLSGMIGPLLDILWQADSHSRHDEKIVRLPPPVLSPVAEVEVGDAIEFALHRVDAALAAGEGAVVPTPGFVDTPHETERRIDSGGTTPGLVRASVWPFDGGSPAGTPLLVVGVLLTGVAFAGFLRRTDGRLDLRSAFQTKAAPWDQALIGQSDRSSGTALDGEIQHALVAWSNCTEGLLTADIDGHILAGNPEMERLFGHSPESLVGQPLDILLLPQDRGRHVGYLRLMTPGLRTRMGAGRLLYGLHRDGSKVPLEIQITRFDVNGAPRFLAVIRNISAVLQQKAELQETVGALQRSNAELDQFAYVASHDLRAPLRVIGNAARWIEEDVGEALAGETKDAMRLLHNRIARMDKLLLDLLEHSRIGRVTEDHSPTTLAMMMDEVRDLVDQRDGIRIEQGDGFDAITVPNMPALKILINLVGNAIKHHDRAEGCVRVEATADDRGLTFAVADDGPGIPKDMQKRVFNMFQTLRPRDQVEGSGMGLAIILKSVEMAGGSIRLSSEGRGCVFTVDLPSQLGNQPKGESRHEWP